MSSSFTSDLSNEIKLSFKKHAGKYGSKIGIILASVFKCFTSNEAELGSKVSKVLEEIGEADQANFNDFYNSLLKMVTYAYRERFTVDQLESELSEMGLDAQVTAAVAEKYKVFSDYIESSEAQADTTLIGKYRLIDFVWEFRETIFDTELKVGKNSIVYGTFLYQDTSSGQILKHRCLITEDVAEGISREIAEAMQAAQKFAK